MRQEKLYIRSYTRFKIRDYSRSSIRSDSKLYIRKNEIVETDGYL